MAQHAQKRHVARKAADGQAVPRGGGVEVIGGAQGPGAGHVLQHDGRIAGDVLADMLGDEARIGVIAAAGAVTEHQLHRAAAIEVGGCLGLRAGADTGEGKGQRKPEQLSPH